MANPNAPYGFPPICKSKVGGPVQLNSYVKGSGVGTAIFQNDVVSIVAGGITPGGTPGTSLYTGVALNYGAASTATSHLVVDDPFQLFEGQEDGVSSALVDASDVRLNCNFLFSSGDTLLKRSKHQLDGSTAAGTSSLDAKIDHLIADPSNQWGTYARFAIQFNKHDRVTTGTTGA